MTVRKWTSTSFKNTMNGTTNYGQMNKSRQKHNQSVINRLQSFLFKKSFLTRVNSSIQKGRICINTKSKSYVGKFPIRLDKSKSQTLYSSFQGINYMKSSLTLLIMNKTRIVCIDQKSNGKLMTLSSKLRLCKRNIKHKLKENKNRNLQKQKSYLLKENISLKK